MDIEDLLDAVFDAERLTNGLATTADELEAIINGAEQEALRLRNDFNAAEVRLEVLDDAVREQVLGGVQEKLEVACKLLGHLVEAADPEKGISVIEPVLGELQRRYGYMMIAIPDEVQEEVETQVRDYEKKILARIGLDPKSVEHLINDIADACKSGQPASFGDSDQQNILLRIDQFRKKLCLLCKEGKRFLSLFTLDDVRNIIGGLRDVCVITIDATAVVTTPDVTLVTLFTSVKSIKKAGESFLRRSEQFFSLIGSTVSRLNVRAIRNQAGPRPSE